MRITFAVFEFLTSSLQGVLVNFSSFLVITVFRTAFFRFLLFLFWLTQVDFVFIWDHWILKKFISHSYFATVTFIVLKLCGLVKWKEKSNETNSFCSLNILFSSPILTSMVIRLLVFDVLLKNLLWEISQSLSYLSICAFDSFSNRDLLFKILLPYELTLLDKCFSLLVIDFCALSVWYLSSVLVSTILLESSSWITFFFVHISGQGGRGKSYRLCLFESSFWTFQILPSFLRDFFSLLFSYTFAGKETCWGWFPLLM